MGVDIWRLRDAPSTDTQGSQDSSPSVPDARTGDAASEDARQVCVYSAGADGDVLVLLNESPHEVTGETPRGKLLDAILLALRSSRDQATLAGSVVTGEPQPVSALVKRCSPWLILALGAPAGLDAAKAPDESSRGIVIHADDLLTLMTRPDAKSRLWRSIVKSGAMAVGR